MNSMWWYSIVSYYVGALLITSGKLVETLRMSPREH